MIAAARWPRLAWRAAQAAAIPLRGGSLGSRRARYAGWCASVLGDLGIEVSAGGAAVEGAALFASNHLSWLDSLVLAATAEVSFVAKHEIRQWPLIGTMIENSGGVFIRRDDPEAIARAVRETGAMLVAGHAVCVFAEATTGDGRSILPFRSSFFEAAVASRRPVVPVGLRYRAGETDCRDALWRQDEPFRASLLRVLRRQGPLRAEVQFGDAIETLGRTRQELAQAAEAQVSSMLGQAVDRPAAEPAQAAAAVHAEELDLLKALVEIAGPTGVRLSPSELLATPLARLGLDSLSAIPVLLTLEEKLKRPIPDDALAGFTNGATVGDFLRALRV